MFNTPCVIFAGGKSSRMGEDKALLPFGNKQTLTQFQYERLKQIFQNVYISCKDAKKFTFLQENKEKIFIEDINTDSIYAPTTGFISIFNALHVSKIFVLSVDTPFISKREIIKIISHENENFDAVIATTSDPIHPMCGVYSRSLYPAFENMLQNNEHKLTNLLKTSNTLFVNFEDESNFLNLNHPNEYQEALLRLNQQEKITK